MKTKTLIIMLIQLALLMLLAACGSNEPDQKEAVSQEIELPSLQAKLDEKKAQFEKMAPEDIKRKFEEGGRAVAMSGVLETALKVGDTAPDFTLPNAVGQQINLYELLQRDVVILTWYRGGW